VVVGPAYPFRGGISHYTTLLCRHLQERHAVRLISFKRQYPAWLFPGKTQLDPSRVKMMINGERVLDPLDPMTWFRAVKAVRTFAPDLVIFQWWNPFFAVPYFFISSRSRHRIPGKIWFECHNVIPHETSPLDSFLIRMAFSAVDRFIVHSEADKARLLKIKPGGYVVKIPFPTWDVFLGGDGPTDRPCKIVGVRADGPVAPPPDLCKKPHPTGCKHLLFFGNVRPYKGLAYLLEALSSILKEIPVHLWVVGEFYEGEVAYRKQISDLGIADHVCLINRYIPNEEVGDYFKLADLVVLPYVSASQSAVVQVAYSFDKPVVVTAVGGLPEAVEDGVTGFVVPPQDSRALAQTIVRYFKKDKAPEFAQQIRKKKACFSWGRLVQEIEALMQSETPSRLLT